MFRPSISRTEYKSLYNTNIVMLFGKCNKHLFDKVQRDDVT